MIPGSVPIPESPRWQQNAKRCEGDSTPCIVCGKPINNPFKDPKTHFLRLGPGGRSYAIPRETPDQGGAEMGCDPVGVDCLRKYPELKKLAFKSKG